MGSISQHPGIRPGFLLMHSVLGLYGTFNFFGHIAVMASDSGLLLQTA